MYLHAEGVHQVCSDAHLILRQLYVLDSDLTHELLRLSWGGGENEKENYMIYVIWWTAL